MMCGLFVVEFEILNQFYKNSGKNVRILSKTLGGRDVADFDLPCNQKSVMTRSAVVLAPMKRLGLWDESGTVQIKTVMDFKRLAQLYIQPKYLTGSRTVSLGGPHIKWPYLISAYQSIVKTCWKLCDNTHHHGLSRRARRWARCRSQSSKNHFWMFAFQFHWLTSLFCCRQFFPWSICRGKCV